MRTFVKVAGGWLLAACLAVPASFAPAYAQSEKDASTASSRVLQTDPGKFSQAFFLKRQFRSFSIDNQTITGARFEKVLFTDASLHNVHFVDCDFSSSLFSGGSFSNVTFTNCRFTEAAFWYMAFRDVSFLGGSIKMYTDKTREDSIKEMFERNMLSGIRNEGVLLLDGVSVEDAGFFSIEGGRFALKNMDNFKTSFRYWYLVEGKNLVLSIENCTLSGPEEIARLDAPCAVYIGGSTVQKGKIAAFSHGGEEKTGMYVENSTLGDVLIDGIQTFVLKDSVSGARVYAGNIHVSGSELAVEPPHELRGKNVYVSGGGKTLPALRVASDGILHVDGLHVGTASFSGNVASLDLHGVSMDKLHFDGGMKLEGGRWEDVDVRSTMRADSPGVYEFMPVRIFNVRMQDSKTVVDGRSSFSSGAFAFKTMESAEPFVWNDTPVPTREELGAAF